MSFELPISAKERAVGRFIGRMRKALFMAAHDAKEAGLSQRALAERLGKDPAVVNRMLNGEQNLTLRSIAELAWALGLDVAFEFRKRREPTQVTSPDLHPASGGVTANTPPPRVAMSDGNEALRDLFFKRAA